MPLPSRQMPLQLSFSQFEVYQILINPISFRIDKVSTIGTRYNISIEFFRPLSRSWRRIRRWKKDWTFKIEMVFRSDKEGTNVSWRLHHLRKSVCFFSRMFHPLFAYPFPICYPTPQRAVSVPLLPLVITLVTRKFQYFHFAIRAGLARAASESHRKCNFETQNLQKRCAKGSMEPIYSLTMFIDCLRDWNGLNKHR